MTAAADRRPFICAPRDSGASFAPPSVKAASVGRGARGGYGDDGNDRVTGEVTSGSGGSSSSGFAVVAKQSMRATIASRPKYHTAVPLRKVSSVSRSPSVVVVYSL